MKLKIGSYARFVNIDLVSILDDTGTEIAFATSAAAAYRLADTFNNLMKGDTPAATGDDLRRAQFESLCKAWSDNHGGLVPWNTAVRMHAVIYGLQPHQVASLLNLDT